MKYQALLLIAVILVSIYAVQGVSFFSLNEGNEVSADSFDTVETIESTVEPTRPAVYSTEQNDGYVGEQTSLSVIAESEYGQCGDVGASIAFAKDIESGRVLYERNISQRWPIASVSKLMAAVVAVEEYDVSAPVTVTAEDIQKTDGFSTFSAGTTLSVNDMVRALLVGSSNDAAFALADIMGEDAFVGMMQKKSEELGMGQTLFREPSGLSFLNQSTATDLYLLMSYIQTTHAYLLESTRLKTITVKDIGQKKNKTVTNVDMFAGRSNFLGGKTGFIDQSGGNLVALFRLDGKTVFFAVLGSDDRFGDMERLLSCSAGQ